jgi:L-2-hydroxyglutarate oxidase LhgO
MGGRARFGPNVEWLAGNDPTAIDYTVSPDIAARFAPVIATYWPGITEEVLLPDYAGVRPKLSGPGQPSPDFRIDGPQTHGLTGLVNLFGIESPGLTASLAIAAHVAALLD